MTNRRNVYMLSCMSVRETTTRRLGTWAATRDAWFRGLGLDGGVMGALRGHDVVRFRAGARRYVSFAHPDLVDHVLYEGRENYVKSIEYETLRAVFGLALITTTVSPGARTGPCSIRCSPAVT